MSRAADRPSPPSRFVWYDLETTGIHPPSDRIMQFAVRCTTSELEPLGDPDVGYVRLAADTLPHPEACLVTGLTPQRIADGIDEWQAVQRLDEIFDEPGTCVAGYNNLRFDDEFLRFARYRNLLDPYAREWRNGNTRWDLIDLARAACALRPDGIHWPRRNGTVTFELENLCAANGIATDNAHDASADVDATIGFARLLRTAQPRLWDFALAGRLRNAAAALLLPVGENLCVHVSGRYPNRRLCAAPVVSVAAHPQIANRVLVADLSRDITALLECNADELAARLFAPADAGDAERPPVKEVVMNRSPFVAPIAVVREQDAARLSWNFDAVARRRAALAAARDVGQRLREVYDRRGDGPAAGDPEFALYDGFASDADQRAMGDLQAALKGGAEWPDFRPRDQRLGVLAARLKARLRPVELNAAEQAHWQAHVRRCLDEGFGARLSLAQYRREIAALRATERDPRRRRVLDELAAYEPAP